MNRRVLIVGDQPLPRSLLRRALECAGFAVTEASDGATACAVIERERFDAAVLDVVLPDIDGPAIAAALRATASDRSMPILGVSGAVIDHALLPAGLFNHVFAEPFDVGVLVDVLLAYVPVATRRRRRPAPQPVAAVAPPAGSSARTLNGHETVLVLDDDVMVRRFAHEVLTRRGYTVLEAGTGDEALQLAASIKGPIDALISDVVLPGASGPESAARLTAARPGLRVLYISGYSADAGIPAFDRVPSVLQKPFRATDLLHALRALLETGQPPVSP